MAESMSSPQRFPVIDGISPVAGLSLFLAVVFIAGRLAANIRIHRKIFLDDFAALAGFVFFLVFVGLCIGRA